MKKLASILLIFLILGTVAISGCVQQENESSGIDNPQENTSEQQAPGEQGDQSQESANSDSNSNSPT